MPADFIKPLDLHPKIMGIIEKIADKTFKTNKSGSVPFTISENDICCGLYGGLYKPSEHTLTTEYTSYNKGEFQGRYDLVIFNKKDVDYKLSSTGRPNLLNIKKFIAVFELKSNWYHAKKEIEKDFEKDLAKLSKVKSKSQYLYLIYFDFTGGLKKEEVESFKEKGITIVYSNTKDKELHIF